MKKFWVKDYLTFRMDEVVVILVTPYKKTVSCLRCPAQRMCFEEWISAITTQILMWIFVKIRHWKVLVEWFKRHFADKHSFLTIITNVFCKDLAKWIVQWVWKPLSYNHANFNTISVKLRYRPFSFSFWRTVVWDNFSLGFTSNVNQL